MQSTGFGNITSGRCIYQVLLTALDIAVIGKRGEKGRTVRQARLKIHIVKGPSD